MPIGWNIDRGEPAAVGETPQRVAVVRAAPNPRRISGLTTPLRFVCGRPANRCTKTTWQDRLIGSGTFSIPTRLRTRLPVQVPLCEQVVAFEVEFL